GAKAELILLGNGLLGVQEQTRVQPHIARAMAPPLCEELLAILREHLYANTPGPLHPALDLLFERVIGPAAERAEAMWHGSLTRWLMALYLPVETLYLGRDVPPPPCGPMFPRDLAFLRDQELVALWRELGASSTLDGTAARKWS